MSASNGALEQPLTVVNDLHNIPVPDLRVLYEYWLEKKAGGEMPGRVDIRPTEIISLLPRIILIDVEYHPLRFKFRLVGTDIVCAMGKDMTGVYLDDISSQSSTLDRLNWLVENKTTYFATAQLDWMDRDYQKYHVLGLPLGSEDGAVNMILCGVDLYYHNEE